MKGHQAQRQQVCNHLLTRVMPHHRTTVVSRADRQTTQAAEEAGLLLHLDPCPPDRQPPAVDRRALDRRQDQIEVVSDHRGKARLRLVQAPRHLILKMQLAEWHV